MKPTSVKLRWMLGSLFIGLGLFVSVSAQSSDQNFPTPVTTNEITGVIKARDIGDARLTTYFYAFDGGQGDIFINVVTKNLSGDIDIFAVDGLRPLTKMVIYADIGNSETGRLIYLRKPERMLLRVEGRTPGDDAATFHIKFGGSFIALAATKDEVDRSVDNTPAQGDAVVRVNSVGTIIPDPPKPPQSKPTREETTTEKPTGKQKDTKTASTSVKEKAPDTTKEKEDANKKPIVVVEDFPVPTGVKITEKKPVVTKAVTTHPTKPKTTPVAKPPVKTEEKKPDPLASIRLVVQLKDGKVIELAMSEVLKFSVDKGVLTVIKKDGNISRYAILDVAKVTIE